MGVEEAPIHVFMVCFPGQGHINPMLRLAKILASKGLLITFSTTETIGQKMKKANNITDDKPTPFGSGFIRFEFFGDGCPEDDPKRSDLDFYIPQLELVGKQVLPIMIKKHNQEGRTVNCFINNPFIPWVCDVAFDFGIPCATLWVQSCAVFSAYYHFYHKTVPFPSQTQPNIDVEIPSLPLLKYDEVPTFLHPLAPYQVLGRAILGQFKNLSKSFCVLADTFQELEHEIIENMSKVCLVKPIGPLFKNPNVVSNENIIGGDIMKGSDDSIEWLNSKTESSVVYISFGTIAFLKQEQIDEIAYALLNPGLSFLWVLKPPDKAFGLKPHVLPNGFLEKVGDKGKIVQWSPQEKVLAHSSIACFLTHCGWNSSVEALTSGVPVLTFPQWGDQVTNAKFLVDVFRVGVRLSRGEEEKRLVMRDEIEKGLVEIMVGKKAEKFKKSAFNWKKLAQEAVAEGGSSGRNIQEFVDEIRKKCKTTTIGCL